MTTLPVKKKYDVIVIGAGIVGLGAAWAARKSGASVLVLERSSIAEGASIRNFGMIWPLGQPAGIRRSLALRNRSLWAELAAATGIFFEECGSLHLAHHPQELQILEEFVELDGSGLILLNCQETIAKTPGANRQGLLGALWSPLECRVDPRQAIGAIPSFLKTLGVDIHFETFVHRIEGTQVIAADGRSWQGDRILICNGADWASLYPEQLSQLGLKRCKLQMMRTVAKPTWRLGPHLASGLTLRHYESFAICPSLQDYKIRISEERPELDRYGIHVMASQSKDGEIVLGDSHLYDDEITPFRSEEIDRLMLSELQKVYSFPDWTIDQRWTGVYAKRPGEGWIHSRLDDRVEAINGFGGAGMSMSLAVTEMIVTSQNRN